MNSDNLLMLVTVAFGVFAYIDLALAKDYYKILGVSRDANDRQIKKAFRKLAMKYHPDKNKQKDAEAKFREIAEGRYQSTEVTSVNLYQVLIVHCAHERNKTCLAIPISTSVEAKVAVKEIKLERESSMRPVVKFLKNLMSCLLHCMSYILWWTSNFQLPSCMIKHVRQSIVPYQ